MQGKRKEILEAIILLTHNKVKYSTFPKWIRIADIVLTFVYIAGYALLAGWLTYELWQLLRSI